VALLPFFVLGWKVKQWHLADKWLELQTAVVWRWRAAAIVLFGMIALMTAAGIGTWRQLLLRRFLLYDGSYASIGYPQWWAGALRLGFVGVGVLACFAFLALMPRRRTWFSAMGTRTMYIYLLHALILYPIRNSGLLDGARPLWVLGVVIASSFGMAVVLGLPVAQRIFRPIVEPSIGWMFNRTPRSAADSTSQDAPPSESIPQPAPAEEKSAAVVGHPQRTRSATILEWHH
jgi:fucose 4-O-acetylase-like acetyltransferase